MIWVILYVLKTFGIPIFFIWYGIKLTYRRCNSKVCMVGKTAVVTGGNKGIGYQTSLGLAARGCRVIIACRSNAEKEKNEIIRLTHNHNVVVKHLDLSSLASVRKFAKEINETEKKLDVLINNAGIGAMSGKYTCDGLNPTMQTNYFGPFLLTHLLVDLMKKAGHARIVNVSSGMMLHNNLTVNNLNYPECTEITNIPAIRIYSNSKCAQLIASNIFAEKLKQYHITSNTLHPGTVATEIYTNSAENTQISKNYLFAAIFVLKFLFKSAEEAAQPSLRVAISNKYRHITGTMLFDFPWFPMPWKASDRDFCKKIWEASEAYVKLLPSEKI